MNFKKSLIAIIVGLALIISALPTNLNKLFLKTSASSNEAYNSPATVDVGGSFEEDKTAPEKWTVDAKYEDIESLEGDDNKDSTSYNGIISTDPLGWDKYYLDIIEDWMEEWDKSHEFEVALNRTKVKEALETALLGDNKLLTNPLVQGFNADKTESYKILAMLSGSTFTKYLKDDESDIEIQNSDRKAFVTYTSNSFKLDQYSFYAITFYVKTTDGAKVNVSLTGDIEKEVFTPFQTPSSTPKTYYFYSQLNSDKSISKTFLSETPNTADSIIIDGHKYIADGDEFIIDTTDGAYDASLNGYTVKFDNKTTLASPDGWEKRTIYISTTKETSISLNLALGSEDDYSTGNAFFDDVTVTKMQLLDFYQSASNSATSAIIDNREILKANQNDTTSRNYTVLEDFETSVSWKAVNADLETVDLTTVEESTVTKLEDTFPSNNPSNKNKVLKVNAHDKSDIIINSDKITLDQGRYYRISFWATSTNSGSKISVEFIGTKADGSTSTTKDTSKPFQNGRDEEKPSSVNNFWTNYVFYVRSTTEMETSATIKITVSAGQILYFDNLVIENTTKAEYSDTSNNKIDLATSFKDQIIGNGNFFDYNSVEEKNYSNPLPPSNWTNTTKADVYEYYEKASSDKFTKAYLENDAKLTFNAEKTTITYDGKEYVKAEDSNTYNYFEQDKIVSKFVLMEDQKFEYDVNKSAYYNKTHDLEIETTIVAGIVNGTTKISNILRITSTSKEATTYKSPLINLSSTNSVYIIAIDVKTDIASRANIRLVDTNDKVYASFKDVSTYNSSTGTSDWKTVKFYVGTGLENIKLYLELEFAESIGTLEFRNIYGLKTSTTTILDGKLNKTHEELTNEGIAVVNLAKETFIEHSNSINSTTHLYDANLYEQEKLDGKTSGIFGVLDTTAPHSDFSSITSKDAEVSPYVLIVKNNAGESTQINALKKFTIAKEKALQITITAKVEGLTDGKCATISFGDLNAAFEITSNEYKEYTLYIDNTESDKASTVKYYISMLETAGTLVIDNITVTSLNNLDSANSEYPDGDTDTVKFVTTNQSETEEEKEETKTDDLTAEEEDNTLEIFLAVLSSLLLVAAIIFAVLYTRFKALHKPRKQREKNIVSGTDDGQKGFV